MTHDMTVNQKALQHVPPYSSLLTWIWMIWQSFWRPSGTCIDAGTITWLHAVPLSHCTKKTSTKYRAKKTAQGNIEIPIRKKAFRAYPPGNSHILSGERENHLKGPLKGNILVFRRVPRMVVMFMYHNCVVGIPKVQSRTTFLRVGNVLKITCSSSLFFLKKNNCKPGPQKFTWSVASMIFHPLGRKWIPCLSILLLLSQNNKFKSSAVELSESDESNDESHWHVISPIQSMGMVDLPTFGWYWWWISR